MPKCALNEDTNDPSDWAGTDDDNWLMRWRIKRKHWFAFANRCPPGLTWTIVFLPGLYLLPFSFWFTGWSWWYLFPLVVLPVARKWRRLPTTLLAIKGKGPWRLESVGSQFIVAAELPTFMFLPRIETSAMSVITPFYLSRIQKWCRWHVALQWPLLIQFHWYWNKKDVPAPDTNPDVDEKYFGGYRGWHYDEDEIYWGDGAALGNPK